MNQMTFDASCRTEKRERDQMNTPAKRTARQLIFPEPYRVDFDEVELSAPGPCQILARTVLSGISHGTEMMAHTGGAPFHDQIFTAERRLARGLPSTRSIPTGMRYDDVNVVEA